MKIVDIRINEETNVKENYAVAIGNFDGLHYGHRQVIDMTKELAIKNDLKLGVMSFDITPRQIVNNIDNYSVLRSFEQKNELLSSFGVDALFLIHFNNEVRNILAKEFVEKMIIANNIKCLVCGFDFRFGKDKQGDTEYLKTFTEFETVVLDRVDSDNEKIASSRIHELVAHGEIEQVNELLVTPYSIIGKVIAGNRKGRTIGFPTANVLPSVNYRVPQTGVYATKAIIDGVVYLSMTNIGHNPTFNFTNATSIETNIFDFDQDIYGKEIEIIFEKCLRKERIFDSVDELVDQLEKDKREILSYFK